MQAILQERKVKTDIKTLDGFPCQILRNQSWCPSCHWFQTILHPCTIVGIYTHPGVSDPVWGDKAPYGAKDVDCSYHWLEFGIGADAKIWGPVHMGWSLRYRKRASYDDGRLGKSWYVPGYGKSDGSAIGVLFNIAVEILRHKM